MFNHEFILTPSSWIGEGKIKLNMVDEELGFFTRWTVAKIDGTGKIECLQEIQIKGLTEVMHNQFIISEISSGNFLIELENDALGRVEGKGIINEKLIAWEFRIPDIGFEGFEFYEKQKDQYLMRAEYSTTPGEFRTAIQGRVWQPQEIEKK